MKYKSKLFGDCFPMRLFSLLVFITLVFSITIEAQSSLEDAKSLYKNNQTEKAKTILLTILEGDDKIAEAHYFLGLIYFTDENNPDEAEEHLEEAIDLEPDSAKYHFLLGALYGRQAQKASIFSQLSLAGNCKDEFETAVKLDPKYLPARRALIQYLIEAPGIAGGSIEEAEHHIKELKDLDLVTYYSFKSIIASRNENFIEAESFLLKALDIDSSNVSIINSLGYLYIRFLNKPDDAITQFQKMVTLKPDMPNCYDSLGDGYMNKRMYNEALSSYQKALSLDPNFHVSLFNSGKAYELLGEKERAISTYKEYLNKFRDGQFADFAEDRLDELE